MNADQIKEEAEDLQKEVEETTQTLKAKALQWQQTAPESVGQFAKATDTYVRENPWPAVGIAAFAAFTLGVLIGMRRR